MAIKKKRLITDVDGDGVVLNEYELSFNSNRSDDELEFNCHHSFVKLFRKIEPKYETKQFKLFFLYLTRHLRKDTNALLAQFEDSNKSVRTATIEDIASMLGISLSHCNKFIAESIRIGAISRTRISSKVVFVVNPAYAFYGRYVHVSIFEIFKNSKDFINNLSKSDIETINKNYDM